MKKQWLGIIKLIMLLLALPLVLWLSTLSKTAGRINEYYELKGKASSTPALEVIPEITATRMVNGEPFIGELGALTKSENIVMLNYCPKLLKEDDGLFLYSANIHAQGGFISLLKLVHFLEQKEYVGISSLSFHRNPDRDPLVSLDAEIIQLVNEESR